MKPQIKRIILIALLTITGLATLAILASCFLFNSDYRSEEFVMLSGMGLGFLVLISFAAFSCLYHHIWKFPALAGMIVSTLLMFLHPLVALMGTTRSSYNDPLFHLISRLDGTGFTLAGLLCLIPFVMAPNIKLLGRLLQLAVTASYLLIGIFFQIIIWNEDLLGRDMVKFIFALFIFAIAGSIAISLLNKFFGIKIKVPVTYSSTTLHLQCPRCQTFQNLPEGDSTCQSCKLKFKIEIEEPTCPKCGYNLYYLTVPRCPECGTMLAPGSAGGSTSMNAPPTEPTPGGTGG